MSPMIMCGTLCGQCLQARHHGAGSDGRRQDRQRQVQDVTTSGEGQGRIGTPGDEAEVRQPIGVGPEMVALARIYTQRHLGGDHPRRRDGPGRAGDDRGRRGTVQAIQDGRWIVLDW